METTAARHEGAVRVEFREADSGDIVIVTHMQASELPASFEVDTVLDLGIGTWEVVRAEPTHAEAFRRRGELSLWLRRLEEPAGEVSEGAQDDELLFAPPTRQGQLPPLLDQAPEEQGEALYLYEEDWRQNEILALAHQGWVLEQFELIGRTPPGATYPRPATPGAALGAGVELEVLRRDLEGQLLEPVVLCEGARERVVEGGFGLETPQGTILYGRCDPTGRVLALGIHLWERPEQLLEALEVVGGLWGAREHLFVSWCSASQAPIADIAGVA